MNWKHHIALVAAIPLLVGITTPAQAKKEIVHDYNTLGLFLDYAVNQMASDKSGSTSYHY